MVGDRDADDTVGYGDMVPVTAVGKILGGIVSIVGIGTLALFSGVITVGFLDQLRIGREQTERPVAAAGASANGEDVTGVMERYGVIAVAGAEMCPCCGRPMQAASAEVVLRAAGASNPVRTSAERPL